MTVLRAAIAGIGVWGPGLPGWEASRAVLAGEAAYTPADTPVPAPLLLPANERRRTGPVVRLALAVAAEAVERAGIPMTEIRSVFASANGDGPVVGVILDALTTAEPGAQRIVSPTQFHNSVHNAAAGYWSIASANPLPANCIGGHDATWAAGLLAAMVEVQAGEPVLLCVYDHPMPARYAATRPILAPFGVALVLVSVDTAVPSLARLAVEYLAGSPADAEPLAPALRSLAAGNPAARCLRLLERLAGGAAGRCDAGFFGGRLDVALDKPGPR